VQELLTTENLIALLTLTSLEVVLGIDNVVFISILAGKLPPHQQANARRVGLGLAMIMRILLLLAIGWVMGLTRPLFWVPKFWMLQFDEHMGISGRDLIMLIGGLFLIAKATWEIHDKLEGDDHTTGARVHAAFSTVIIQIVLLDIVFSLDSVITAVGMARSVAVMIIAVVIAVAVMLAFAGAISAFVQRHPTVKMLALSFLILIGVTLMAEGLHFHIPKGYVYFAMAFSLGVELLNLRLRKVSTPVELHRTYVAQPPGRG
jgi:predicted tellurium resistance membrane protein TerC